MPLELKVKANNKETVYKRKAEPMLENVIDALKIQRLEIEMFQDPKKLPTDEQNTRHIKLLAEFAARFWGDGLTADDVLKGVSSLEGINQIEKAVAQTLGTSIDDDDEETEKDPKK